MKRLHAHVSVENLEEAIKFYSTLFGVGPVKQKSDYAKWLLEDPRVNFAISSRGRNPGFDHFGIQVEEDTELSEVRERFKKAELQTFDEGETTCCYAKADKTWVMDSAGLPWEAYKVMTEADIYHKVEEKIEDKVTCCR